MQHNDSEQDRLDWVTRFDDPVVNAAERTQRSRAFTIGLGTLFGGAGIAAIAFLMTALSRPAEEESGLGASRTPTPTPSAPVVVETLEPDSSLIPNQCDSLFSESMAQTLRGVGLELGSEWDGPWSSGSADAELQRLLDDAELDCHWSQDDPLAMALLTQVTEISSHEAGIATARMQELGFNELSEHGGVRYVHEQRTGDGISGESHFFRDGLWFATHWRGHGQFGYTADMVQSVFS